MSLNLKSAVLALTLLGGGTAQAADRPHFFVAHLGPDSCVPLEDVGDEFQRVYYGAGLLRLPADFARQLRSTGMGITDEQQLPDGVIVFKARTTTGIDAQFVMFDDSDYCRKFMATQQK